MKILYILLASTIAVFTSACQSKEEKAAGLIKQELSNALYDFDSYQPIKTTVTEAFSSAYNDTTCWYTAMAISYCMKDVSEYYEKANDAKERMEIWGPPSYYSSSYSDNQYYKYRRKWEENLDKATRRFEVAKSFVKELQDSIKSLDSTRYLGWEVFHRFRCKTKGGHAAIGNYRYIIDKEFTKIIFREDLDDDNYSEARNIIESALKGDFNNINDNKTPVINKKE